MENDKQDAYLSYSPMNYMSVQSMRERGIEMAWLKLEFFLRQFTTANPEHPDDSQWDSIELNIFSGFDNQNTEDKCWRAIDIANKKLGAGQIINVQKPEFYKNPPKKQTIWRLKKENFKSIVDLLIEGDPWPVQEKGLGPVELIAFYKFYLKDTKTKEILPGQTFESTILIWLTRNSFCTPTLNFPFAQPDNDFWNYIKTVEPYLPFKLETKNLRWVKKNKKGTGYVSRKL
jgi:hypothetical protein